MPEAIPALTIRIRPDGTEKAFVFENDVGDSVAVGSRGSFNQALFQQSGLRDGLETLKTIGGGALKLGPHEADKAIQQIYDIGQLVMRNLIDGDLDVTPALYGLLRGALAKGQLGGRTPRVHVTTANNDHLAHAIPFELVPFQGRGRPQSVIGDDGRLGEALDGFLGFSTVVARGRGERYDGGMMSRHDNRLPVKLFHNVDLPAAKAESDFFASRSELDLDGPWPVSELTEDVFLKAMQELIFDPIKRIDGSSRPLPDQIQHFACHCETFDDPNAYRFILAADPSKPFSMTLAQLERRLLELAGEELLSECEMPLVFLNACGSGVVDPRQFGSFPKFFLANRNRGFIGPQTMVPDPLAGEFSKTFYLGILLQGMTVGEAVRHTRRKLAERYNNLLGILYMHYGPAELRLSEPSERPQ